MTLTDERLLRIFGAREHNLKNISLTIPRDRFVVVTGVSGSGKSTLAFDLIFGEGQRRFLDAMNAYARQFVEQLARPDVDLITGIPPTVSIEQRQSRGGGKSTVATVTEIYHFLRLLFAKLGTQYCPECQLPVAAQSRDQLTRQLQEDMRRRGDLLVLAPVVRHRKGFHSDVAAAAARQGYAEIRADGKIYATGKPFRLDRFKEHNLEIVVGVLEAKAKRRAETATERPPQVLVDEALELGKGTLFALDNHKTLTVHSTERSCRRCHRSFPPLDPKDFSYNSPQGWCPRCRGFGELFYLPEVDRGARADAIEESWFEWQEGKREPCPDCGGTRLNPVSRAVRLEGWQGVGAAKSRVKESSRPMTIDSLARATVGDALGFFQRLRLRGRSGAIARDILPEIRERLHFLRRVGLDYLQLGRSATTLSGGEAQRIRLAAQLGSNLSGVLYVLDEPTIGLHARDNEQLLDALALLKSRGNSLIVVEHDEATMRQADHIIDLGPGAGVHGGQVVAAGTLSELMGHPESATGRALREQRRFPLRGVRRPVSAERPAPRAGSRKKVLPGGATKPVGLNWLTLRGAQVHNLKRLTVSLPLQRLVVVTGVSGSGKSTLVGECLLPALSAALAKGKSSRALGPVELEGFESIRAVHEVDQSPIGRTPRSTPATYVGFFDTIRELFAQTPEARMRGYGAGRFSFNAKEGRCPTCEGAGVVKLEMNFLPPAYVTCEGCQGLRFSPETLEITYRDKSVAGVLDLSVDEALDFFSAHPKIQGALQALQDTGLGYLKLGQTSPTLSGGEAQRIRLVSHLLAGLKPARTGPNMAAQHALFVLEEPTIGLHLADVQKLLEVLQRLVDLGHSVIVIEHQLDLIAEADWVIDLGPEGGAAGGELVVAGPPETVADEPRSHTGRYLRELLGLKSLRRRSGGR